MFHQAADVAKAASALRVQALFRERSLEFRFPIHNPKEQVMAKSSGGKGGGGRQGGRSGGGKGGQGGGWPSKTGNPSGTGRTNAPPGGSRKS